MLREHVEPALAEILPIALSFIDRVLGDERDGRRLFKLLCNEGSFNTGPRQNNIRRKLAEVHAAAYGDGLPPLALSPVT